jgi:hypothetical protein
MHLNSVVKIKLALCTDCIILLITTTYITHTHTKQRQQYQAREYKEGL